MLNPLGHKTITVVLFAFNGQREYAKSIREKSISVGQNQISTGKIKLLLTEVFNSQAFKLAALQCLIVLFCAENEPQTYENFFELQAWVLFDYFNKQKRFSLELNSQNLDQVFAIIKNQLIDTTKQTYSTSLNCERFVKRIIHTIIEYLFAEKALFNKEFNYLGSEDEINIFDQRNTTEMLGKLYDFWNYFLNWTQWNFFDVKSPSKASGTHVLFEKLYRQSPEFRFMSLLNKSITRIQMLMMAVRISQCTLPLESGDLLAIENKERNILSSLKPFHRCPISLLIATLAAIVMVNITDNFVKSTLVTTLILASLAHQMIKSSIANNSNIIIKMCQRYNQLRSNRGDFDKNNKHSIIALCNEVDIAHITQLKIENYLKQIELKNTSDAIRIIPAKDDNQSKKLERILIGRSSGEMLKSKTDSPISELKKTIENSDKVISTISKPESFIHWYSPYNQTQYIYSKTYYSNTSDSGNSAHPVFPFFQDGIVRGYTASNDPSKCPKDLEVIMRKGKIAHGSSGGLKSLGHHRYEIKPDAKRRGANDQRYVVTDIISPSNESKYPNGKLFLFSNKVMSHKDIERSKTPIMR